MNAPVRPFTLPSRPAAAAVLVLLGMAGSAAAEPVFAIRSGNSCQACHVNMTGGGKRTTFGNAYGQVTLPARAPGEFWNGQVMEYLSVGGNLRAGATAVETPGRRDSFEFDVDEAQLYVEFPLLSDRLTVYLDQQVAPGTTSREVFALFTFRNRSAWIKAGRFFLPFGLRLEDDTEFVRQVPGYNMNAPDSGIEAGITLDDLELILAVTNGSAGGDETDTGKQFSLLASYIRRQWRIGLSANFNDSGRDQRLAVGGFAGLRTGPVSWLAELDYIDDQGLDPQGREQIVGFVEGNWLIRSGHNLKLSFGGFDPDENLSNDEQNRYSLVYEYSPLAYVQLRAGLRLREGIPQNATQNSDLYFIQLHGYF